MMNTEIIETENLKGKSEGYFSDKQIFVGEIEGVSISLISVKGAYFIHEVAQPWIYDVLLSLNGNATVEVEGSGYRLGKKFITRIPYNRPYSIYVNKGNEIQFLRLRKSLDKDDLHVISEDKANHLSVYIKAIDSCPVYTEDIKSSKTLNRMILPEGMVPRFAMGSVETEGPDKVGEHVHPMLDQIFFGLEGCNCSCFAQGDKAVLTEDMMLHIPLGSNHYVSVAEGDKLAYIWMDFFLTIEGEKYMGEQHQINED